MACPDSQVLQAPAFGLVRAAGRSEEREPVVIQVSVDPDNLRPPSGQQSVWDHKPGVLQYPFPLAVRLHPGTHAAPVRRDHQPAVGAEVLRFELSLVTYVAHASAYANQWSRGI